MSNVVNLTRPGQCCGLCRHMRPTGDERRWHRYACAAITKTNGEPGNLPVEHGSGTNCPYFRRRSPGKGEGA